MFVYYEPCPIKEYTLHGIADMTWILVRDDMSKKGGDIPHSWGSVKNKNVYKYPQAHIILKLWHISAHMTDISEYKNLVMVESDHVYVESSVEPGPA